MHYYRIYVALPHTSLVWRRGACSTRGWIDPLPMSNQMKLQGRRAKATTAATTAGFDGRRNEGARKQEEGADGEG